MEKNNEMTIADMVADISKLLNDVPDNLQQTVLADITYRLNGNKTRAYVEQQWRYAKNIHNEYALPKEA